MRTCRIATLGSVLMGAALLCGAGFAQAQGYYGPDDRTRVYDDGYGPPPEDVIVRPDLRAVEKHQVLGNVNGEINPTEFSLSRAVPISDLDLSRPEGRMELRDRVHHAARELCFELDARVPALRGYPSADRDCVQRATQEAMRDVYYRTG